MTDHKTIPPQEIPCNMPFERLPQHADDPGIGPVPPQAMASFGALLDLAERLRVSAKEDHIQEKAMVMNRVAYSLQAIATAAHPRETDLRRTLKEHWLTQVECNHESKTDKACCWCGWTSDNLPSVGQTVDAWAQHVCEHVGASAAEMSEEFARELEFLRGAAKIKDNPLNIKEIRMHNERVDYACWVVSRDTARHSPAGSALPAVGTWQWLSNQGWIEFSPQTLERAKALFESGYAVRWFASPSTEGDRHGT